LEDCTNSQLPLSVMLSELSQKLRLAPSAVEVEVGAQIEFSTRFFTENTHSLKTTTWWISL